MPYRSNDDIMAEWRALVARVETVTKQCMERPEDAFSFGVQPEGRREDDFTTISGIRTEHPRNDKAAWLRAVAKALIPEQWTWQVVEMMGGGAELLLQSYRDADPF